MINDKDLESTLIAATISMVLSKIRERNIEKFPIAFIRCFCSFLKTHESFYPDDNIKQKAIDCINEEFEEKSSET